MKRNKIWIVIVLIFVLLAGYVVHNYFIKRSPEKILFNQFGVSLKGYNYSIISFKEQWDYNGDGYCLILFDLKQIGINELNNLIDTNYIKLPIVKKIEVNEIPESLIKSKNGFYLLHIEEEDPRDFKIFIIDTKKDKAVLYYQIM